MMNMLIVEDDYDLRQGIAFSFKRDGYKTVCAGTAAAGIECFSKGRTDIIILDLKLPDGSGIDLCRRIRAESDVPIIMLTACDLETDEVSGLLSGADDYITKPFSLSVLRTRVEVLLRRAGALNIIQSGRFRVDSSLCRIFMDDVELPLSATEFKLLSYFIRSAGRVLSKEQLLAELWDKHGNFVDENTLAVNISRLRSKIEEDPRNPAHIKTIHGLGYMLTKEQQGK